MSINGAGLREMSQVNLFGGVDIDLTPKGRAELVVALSELIQHDMDRVMIIDLGPADGKVAERIEFLGIQTKESPRGAIIV